MTNYLPKYLLLCLAWTVLACACCDDVKTFSLDLLGIQVESLSDGEVIPEQDTLSYANFSISLAFETSTPVEIAGIPSLVQSAYAFTCPWDRYVPNDPAEKIRITTIYDFNEDFEAGTVMPLVDRTDDSYYYYENNNPEWQYHDILQLDAVPTDSALQQFAVEIILESGAVLQDTTVAVVFIE